MCSKPDEVDRDVRDGQDTQDHDDVCMCRDLGRLCGGFGLVGGIPEQLFKKNSSIILDGEGHRGGGAETVLWTADYRGDSQAKADGGG